MSIKTRLAQKTGDLVTAVPLSQKSDLSTLDLSSSESRAPRTGPGQMLAYRSHMQENNQRVDELQNRLSEFDGTLPVKLLDPKVISPSKWANRHNSSFANDEFASLKAEIGNAGGNVQPIRVRPQVGEPGRFEVVFGHRRHQACLQLGILVSAIIEAVDDKSLFASMDRENRSRADLSPFEQGDMYRRALDEGLYPSLRQMCADLGVDLGNASKAIAIARLPGEILAAFESPTQIQFRWGKELATVLQKDPDGVIERAKTIRFGAKHLPPADALSRLLGQPKPTKPVTMDLKRKGKVVGKLTRKSDGSINLSLNGGALGDEQYADLRSAVESLLAKK
jgi:ParB family transcriptional regulator, chromosome partitioning protein